MPPKKKPATAAVAKKGAKKAEPKKAPATKGKGKVATTKKVEPASVGKKKQEKSLPAEEPPSGMPMSHIAVKPRKDGKQMPVTLVSGFLGSGKTSLLSHVLLNKHHKLKCAVIVNEISDFNVDALAVEGAALLQSDERMVEMSNGCICCTLREDLLQQIVDLYNKGFDAVLIESSGIAEPMQTAETFFFPIDGKPDGKTLQHIAPLDNCVTVVDAGNLLQHMSSVDSTDILDAKGTEDCERNIATLMFDQLEFANVVVLNKVDTLPSAEDQAIFSPKGKKAPSKSEAATVETLTALIKRINPYAAVIPVSYSKVDVKQILFTNNFTEKFAVSIQGWMEDIKTGVKHVPETQEYDVSSTSYTPKSPFHPQRLFDWIRKYFILDELLLMTPKMIEEREKASPKLTKKQEEEKKKAWNVDIAQRTERRKQRYGNLFRGKGYAWIGQPRRHHIYATWSQAGNTLSFGSGGTWDFFPQNTSPDLVSVEPGQRLVFIGQDLHKENLKKDLDALLLTPTELKEFKQAVKKRLGKGLEEMDRPDIFADPFGAFEIHEDGEEQHMAPPALAPAPGPKASRKTARSEVSKATGSKKQRKE